MSRHGCILVQALCRPESVTAFRETDWDFLVRQARRADLLAHLYITLDEAGLLAQVPVRTRNHLGSDRILANRHRAAVRWEIDRILRALVDQGVHVILLKGAAYVMADLPPARGRVFHDIDILVPKARLESVERALRRHGWLVTHLDAYDQRYYRQWMHELPPLRHIRRKTVLDVHHTILPETARLHPDPQKLCQAARAVNGYPALYVLAPTDMVLHSATHLFHDGELEHGLRDLVDLDQLLRHFGVEQTFWSALVARAQALELTRPLYYALRYTTRTLGTPVPEPVMREAEVGRPVGMMPAVMDRLFMRALRPDHPSCNDRFSALARWLLYLRSHYLRMPLRLLIPHLVRKAVKGQFSSEAAAR